MKYTVLINVNGEKRKYKLWAPGLTNFEVYQICRKALNESDPTAHLFVRNWWKGIQSRLFPSVTINELIADLETDPITHDYFNAVSEGPDSFFLTDFVGVILDSWTNEGQQDKYLPRTFIKLNGGKNEHVLSVINTLTLQGCETYLCSDYHTIWIPGFYTVEYKGISYKSAAKIRQYVFIKK